MANLHYRELGRVKFIYHGDWSDPELIYKKHSFCYWDIEEMLVNMCEDDLEIDGVKDTEFNKWLKNNKSRCYCALDELLVA